MTADSSARPGSARRHAKTTAVSHQNSAGTSDAYYGHESMAKTAAAFITSLFSCPELPPPTTATTATGAPVPSPKLAIFIAYALHRTRLSSSVTYACLFLLQRLKTRFPAARGSSGHRLFISAFMIASKVVCDDTYSNKSWCVVGQGMFSLREINQMEREMCGYLEWVLNVQQEELEEFTDMVNEQFGAGVATSSKPITKEALVPPVAPHSRPSISVEIPVTAVFPTAFPSPSSREASPGSDPESPSHSDTTSPASSAPHTPPSQADEDESTARVVSALSSKMLSMVGGGVPKVSGAGMPHQAAFAAAVW